MAVCIILKINLDFSSFAHQSYKSLQEPRTKVRKTDESFKSSYVWR